MASVRHNLQITLDWATENDRDTIGTLNCLSSGIEKRISKASTLRVNIMAVAFSCLFRSFVSAASSDCYL